MDRDTDTILNSIEKESWALAVNQIWFPKPYFSEDFYDSGTEELEEPEPFPLKPVLSPTPSIDLDLLLEEECKSGSVHPKKRSTPEPNAGAETVENEESQPKRAHFLK